MIPTSIYNNLHNPTWNCEKDVVIRISRIHFLMTVFVCDGPKPKQYDPMWQMQYSMDWSLFDEQLIYEAWWASWKGV